MNELSQQHVVFAAFSVLNPADFISFAEYTRQVVHPTTRRPNIYPNAPYAIAHYPLGMNVQMRGNSTWFDVSSITGTSFATEEALLRFYQSPVGRVVVQSAKEHGYIPDILVDPAVFNILQIAHPTRIEVLRHGVDLNVFNLR